jgi:quinoprotein glucose dehydrogenase
MRQQGAALAGLIGGVVVILAVGVGGGIPASWGQRQPKSGGAEETLSRLRLADKSLRVQLWASEPLLANPVAFCFDEQGRVFVAETTRFGRGVPDTRSHMYWLDEDLANRTIDDLLTMYKKHKYQGYEKYSDQLRLVWDDQGVGRATKSTIFSGGYNRPQDGLAAGVLAYRGRIYFACIPDLYLLQDTNQDGVADVKESLFSGFGPTAQFLGHDLHGLRLGPDGRLYFTIGDRGFQVVTKEGRRLLYPNMGAVLRCELDGSRLEVIHWGLRNPQELAFDDLGHLFTFDNNSDSGDRARWVYVMEGGDSGWRGGYQYGTLYHTPDTPQGNRGPWNVEKLWHTYHPEQPAWIVPPISHLGNGPAGIAHYPGVGLAEQYQDSFFACDFTADPNSSVIWNVRFRPKGAGFEMVQAHAFLRGIVPTDCDFGPDGAFYWSDWVGGWSPPGKGRLFRVVDPQAQRQPVVAEVQKLLREGFQQRSLEELRQLLGYPHQQVRQYAQGELAARQACTPLLEVARDPKAGRLARLHALWGLGMVARHLPPTDPKTSATRTLLLRTWADLLTDPDAEVRRVAAEQLGDVVFWDRTHPKASTDPGNSSSASWVAPDMAEHLPQWRSRLAELLRDAEPRVRSAAALCYGKLGPPASAGSASQTAKIAYVMPLFELLIQNNNQDPYLRQAAVMGLYYAFRNPEDLWESWRQVNQQDQKGNHPSVRLALVLALRKHRSNRVAEFLNDPEEPIVAEAARAIYEERLFSVLPALARLTEQRERSLAVAYRAAAANYVLGDASAAERLARLAGRAQAPDHLRVFALKLLADWAAPPRRDPITGLTLDLPQRDATAVATALRQQGARLFVGSDLVRRQAAQTIARLGLQDFGPTLAEVVHQEQQPLFLRVEALYALEALRYAELVTVAEKARQSSQPSLRAAARHILARRQPQALWPEVVRVLNDPQADLVEKQEALTLLGQWPQASEAVDRLLADWLDQALAGKLAPELLLDLLEAAENRTRSVPGKKLYAPLAPKVQAYRQAQQKSSDPLAPYLDALRGGDPERGRDIVLNNSAVYCQRCHKLDGQGGEVGPPLNGLAADPAKDHRYFLEAIVFPDARIAQGYETVLLLLQDERTVTGVIKSEDETTIRLVTPENQEVLIRKADVESRRKGPSAMPADLHTKLTRRQLRDLVAFLASLKEPPPRPQPPR